MKRTWAYEKTRHGVIIYNERRYCICLSECRTDTKAWVMAPVFVNDPADIPYELVVSARAKRAILRIVPGRGLVVSIPKGFSQSEVTRFIARHRQWIVSSLAELDAATPAGYRQWPPRRFCS